MVAVELMIFFPRQAPAFMIYSVSLVLAQGDTRMNAAHSSTLIARHAGLDARLAAERNRPHPDDALLARLKKQKLKIKEALARL